MRSALRRMTSGMPTHNLVSDGDRQVAVPTDKLDSMGTPITRFAVVTGTLRHSPTSTRAVYQKLKNVYGRAALGGLK